MSKKNKPINRQREVYLAARARARHELRVLSRVLRKIKREREKGKDT